MVIKKPKKDEVITLEGIVNELTQTLIQVDAHNIAVLGDTIGRVRGLELSLGDTVKITYQNGILLAIELKVKKPKEVHIDKSEKTADVTLQEQTPTVVETKSESQPEVIPSNPDVHIHNYPKCRFCSADTVNWVAPIGDCWSRTEMKLVITNLYQCGSCKMIYIDPQLE
jgi:hypothetical protein